jgi:hypothetical protein
MMELVSWDDDIPTYYGKIKFKFQPMVLVYLPKWVMNWTRANVGIHIPAPWVAFKGTIKIYQWVTSQHVLSKSINGSGFSRFKSHPICF